MQEGQFGPLCPRLKLKSLFWTSSCLQLLARKWHSKGFQRDVFSPRKLVISLSPSVPHASSSDEDASQNTRILKVPSEPISRVDHRGLWPCFPVNWPKDRPKTLCSSCLVRGGSAMHYRCAMAKACNLRKWTWRMKYSFGGS